MSSTSLLADAPNSSPPPGSNDKPDLILQPSEDPAFPEFKPLVEAISGIGEADETALFARDDPESLPLRLAAQKFFARGDFHLSPPLSLAHALAGITRLGLNTYGLINDTARRCAVTYGLNSLTGQLLDEVDEFVKLSDSQYRPDVASPPAAGELLLESNGKFDPFTLATPRNDETEAEIVDIVLAVRSNANLPVPAPLFIAGPDLPIDRSDYDEPPYIDDETGSVSVALLSPIVQIVMLTQSMSDDLFGTEAVHAVLKEIEAMALPADIGIENRSAAQ